MSAAAGFSAVYYIYSVMKSITCHNERKLLAGTDPGSRRYCTSYICLLLPTWYWAPGEGLHLVLGTRRRSLPGTGHQEKVTWRIWFVFRKFVLSEDTGVQGVATLWSGSGCLGSSPPLWVSPVTAMTSLLSKLWPHLAFCCRFFVGSFHVSIPSFLPSLPYAKDSANPLGTTLLLWSTTICKNCLPNLWLQS